MTAISGPWPISFPAAAAGSLDPVKVVASSLLGNMARLALMRGLHIFRMVSIPRDFYGPLSAYYIGIK